MSDQTSTKIPFEIEELLARSHLYQILAFLFRHPSAAQSGFSMKEELPHWREAVDKVRLPEKIRFKGAFKRLVRTLQKTSPPEWIRQFEFCFGHTVQGPVPNYELEYGEEHTHRQPQQLGDITAFYHAFGLQVKTMVHERADHISVECEFLGYLLYKEAYASQNDGEEKALICREAARRFLSEHLGCWLPSFSAKLAKVAGQGLMKEAADFALTFILQDCQKSGISPGPADLPVRIVQTNEDSGCVTCPR